MTIAHTLTSFPSCLNPGKSLNPSTLGKSSNQNPLSSQLFKALTNSPQVNLLEFLVTFNFFIIISLKLRILL